MTRQDKVNAKPSDAHNDEAILRAKAEEANRKRRNRQAQQAAKEAEEQRKREAEEAKKKAEQPKSANLGKKIKVIADGQEFATLNDALRAMEPVVWANENDFRRSCWTKINRGLKTKGEYTLMNHKFTLPQA